MRFANMLDYLRLWINEIQIYFLNKQLDRLYEDRLFGWEVDDEEIQDTINGLESLSLKCSEILKRINAREAQHQRAASH